MTKSKMTNNKLTNDKLVSWESYFAWGSSDNGKSYYDNETNSRLDMKSLTKMATAMKAGGFFPKLIKEEIFDEKLLLFLQTMLDKDNSYPWTSNFIIENPYRTVEILKLVTHLVLRLGVKRNVLTETESTASYYNYEELLNMYLSQSSVYIDEVLPTLKYSDYLVIDAIDPQVFPNTLIREEDSLKLLRSIIYKRRILERPTFLISHSQAASITISHFCSYQIDKADVLIFNPNNSYVVVDNKLFTLDGKSELTLDSFAETLTDIF